jgi:alpha-D-xyloside xylohydrolase
VSVERLPVFVRSGSVVPLSSSGETAAVRLQSDSWTLRVYCGASGTFALYEDEGDGDAFQTGTSRWTDVSWNEREALLVIAPRPGSSSTSQKRRYLRIVFLRDGEESVREVQYNGAEIRVTPQDGNHGA